MKIVKLNNKIFISDPVTKTNDISLIKVYKKESKEHGFYLKVLCDVLALRTKTLDKKAFNKRKNQLYDLRMNIRSHEYKDYILFEYYANYVADEFIDHKIEKQVLDLFEDFCSNTKYDQIDVELSIETLSLNYSILKDNYIAYSKRIAKDIQLRKNEKYPTLDFNIDCINNFDLKKLKNINLELKKEIFFYHSPTEKQINNLDIIDGQIKVDNYKCDDEYEEYEKNIGLDQANLNLFFQSDKEHNKEAMQIFSSIFGGGIFSKLFVNVREKNSLCYTINSNYVNQKVISVFCGLQNDMIEKTMQLINIELDKIKAGDIQEFDIAVEKMISDYKRSANSYQLHKNLIQNNILKNHEDDIEKIIKQFKQVKKKDIIKIAKDLKLTKKVIVR